MPKTFQKWEEEDNQRTTYQGRRSSIEKGFDQIKIIEQITVRGVSKICFKECRPCNGTSLLLFFIVLVVVIGTLSGVINGLLINFLLWSTSSPSTSWQVFLFILVRWRSHEDNSRLLLLLLLSSLLDDEVYCVGGTFSCFHPTLYSFCCSLVRNDFCFFEGLVMCFDFFFLESSWYSLIVKLPSSLPRLRPSSLLFRMLLEKDLHHYQQYQVSPTMIVFNQNSRLLINNDK